MNFLTFLHAFLPLLVQLSEVDGESVQQGLECSDDKPSLLCLTKGYSTFDLPFRRKENMVKIGKHTLKHKKQGQARLVNNQTEGKQILRRVIIPSDTRKTWL